MDLDKFICPRCGEIHNLKDSVIENIELSCEVDNSHGYNAYRSTWVVKYIPIKVCKRCGKILNRNHWLRHILWFVLPQFLGIILGLFGKGYDIKIFALMLLIPLLTYTLAVVIYRDVKSKFYAKKIIAKAKECNAL